MLQIVGPAIEELCAAFERGGFNPTPIIDIGVLVASADGTVTANERAILLDVFQTLLETKLTPQVVDALVATSLEVIELAGVERRTRLVAEILKDVNAVESGVLVALVVAFASDGLSSAERRVVERIAEAGGVTPARLEKLIERVKALDEGGPISVRGSLLPGPKSR